MIRSPPLPSGPWGAQHAPGSGQSPPFSGAITLLSRAAARPSFPNTKPGRGCLRLGKKGKQAMAEQVNLRIARQGWDAWNAHDVEGWLKILDEKHVWETDTLPAPEIGRASCRERV